MVSTSNKLPNSSVVDHDHLNAMIRLENLYYCCPDYMQSERPSVQECTNDIMNSILRECASLVTDPISIQQAQRKQGIRRTISKSKSILGLQLKRTESMNNSKTASIVNEDSEECTKAQAVTTTTISPKSAIIPSFLCDDYDVVDDEAGEDEHDIEQQLTSFVAWRKQLCQWAYTIIDLFEGDREIVELSVQIFDRYIAKKVQQTHIVGREDYQLYFVTSLYVAVKTFSYKKLSINTLIDFGYTQQQLNETEWDILQTLNWHIGGPTAAEYCRTCFPASICVPKRCSTDFESLRSDVLSICVIDSFFVACPRSVIALAATSLAIRLCSTIRNTDSSWTGQFISSIQNILPQEPTKTVEYTTIYLELERLYNESIIASTTESEH